MKPIRRWEVLERFNGKVIVIEEIDCGGVPKKRVDLTLYKTDRQSRRHRISPRRIRHVPYPLVREVASGIVYEHGQVRR